MKFTAFKTVQSLSADEKVRKKFDQFEHLLAELGKKELPDHIIKAIHDAVDQLNVSTLTGSQMARLITQKQTVLLKLVEKECKIVPKNHYRNLWMLLGMSSFGLPIGVAFGIGLGNIGLLGLGLPIGMAIGLAFGSSLDKKALREGRQLDIDIEN